MPDTPPPRILGVAYPSLYVADLAKARAHWEGILGPAAHAEDAVVGFRLGDTWLTLLDARHGPAPTDGLRGAEFALRVATSAEVDALYERLLASGARGVMAPSDTWMYERMRYACVDDPYGLRLDVYCPLAPIEPQAP